MGTNYTIPEAVEFAKATSKSVVIRSYVNLSSSDDRRDATPEEAELVERAIVAALQAIKRGRDVDSAKDTAEFFILHNTGDTHINTYHSVYIPIGEFLNRYM